jgi:hypothetical protein
MTSQKMAFFKIYSSKPAYVGRQTWDTPHLIYTQSLLQCQIKASKVYRKNFFSCFLGTEDAAKCPKSLSSSSFILVNGESSRNVSRISE